MYAPVDVVTVPNSMQNCPVPSIATAIHPYLYMIVHVLLLPLAMYFQAYNRAATAPTIASTAPPLQTMFLEAAPVL